jgi:hypothetical protein
VGLLVEQGRDVSRTSGAIFLSRIFQPVGEAESACVRIPDVNGVSSSLGYDGSVLFVVPRPLSIDGTG